MSCLLYHPFIARRHCNASLPVHPCFDHSLRGLCCHASCIILPSHDTTLHLLQSIHAAITLCAVSVVMPPVSSFHRTTVHCISSSPSMLRSLSERSLLSCLLYHPSIARQCTASLPVHPCCDHSLSGLCCHASCIILPSHDSALHLFQSIHAAITLCAVSVVMPPVSSFHRTTLYCISSSPSMLRSLSARSLLSCLLYHPSIARHCTASLPVHPCCDHSLRGLCCHASCIILPLHTTLHCISSSSSMLRSLSARSLLSCLLYHPSIARHCTASLPVHPCCDHSLRGLCCHASCIILPSHDTALHLFQSIHAAITLCAVSVVMPPVSSFHRTTLHCISSSPSMLRSLSARSLLSCLLYHPSIARHCTASLPVHPCCDHSLRGLCCHASCIILPSHDTALHLFQFIHAAITLCAVYVVMPPVSSFHCTTTLHCISFSSSMLRSLSARSLLPCLLYHPYIARQCNASLPVHPCCDHSLRGLCCHAFCIILPSHDTALHLFQSIHAAITLCAVSVVMPPVSSFHRTTLHCISSSPSMLRSLSARSLLPCLLYHPYIARQCNASLPVHPCCDHSQRGLCCHASCIILPSHDTALHLFQSIHAAITLCAVSVVMPPVSSFHRTTVQCISSCSSMLRSLSARSLLPCLLYHPSITRQCAVSLPVHPCCDHCLRGLCCHASCIILPSHDNALYLFQFIHAAITLSAVSVVMPPVSSFHRTTLHCISSSPSMLRSHSARSLLSCLLCNPSIARRHCTASLSVHPCCDHSLSGLCCHASCIILSLHDDTAMHLFQSTHASITLWRSLLSCLLYHPSVARHASCITASLTVHPCCDHSLRGLCCHASCIILPSHDSALHLFQSIHAAITL